MRLDNSDPLIWQPIKLGPYNLRGRIFIPAHQPGLAVDGIPGKKYIEYQRTRAKAGAAMQITGATPVAPSAIWQKDHSLLSYTDKIIDGYKELSAAVHGEGGLMLAQLAHAGPTELGGRDVIGPSNIISELSQQSVRSVTATDLDTTKQQFIAAAERCKKGGLAGIEISLAHGLFLASFLSPVTNLRNDRYGGSLQNRARFPLEVIKSVREDVCGDNMILGIRLVADDLVDGGLTAPQAAELAELFQTKVDYINVIAGNNNVLESRFRHWPPTPAPFGLFRELARIIKQRVAVPVCVAGRITTVEAANEVLQSGDADLVGMVRAHIADPELIAKAKNGRERDIRPCVGANLCVNSVISGTVAKCMFNADPSHGEITTTAKPAGSSKAVVVGGGPGGLEASRYLAANGYTVNLFEKNPTLGGQLATWSKAPSRRELKRVVRWWEDQIDKLAVDVHYAEYATCDKVLAADPSIIVIATGALPPDNSSSLLSDNSATVHDPLSAMATPEILKEPVAICDELGYLDCTYVAEHLRCNGFNDVTIVTKRLFIGEGDGPATTFPMIRRLAELDVNIVERSVMASVENGFIEIKGVFGESRDPIRAGSVVRYTGLVSDCALSNELTTRGYSPKVIGDAVRPRRLEDAVHEGAELSLIK